MKMYHEKAPEKRSVKQNIQSSPVKRLDKWQLLMNNYETKLGIQPTFAPVDQNIEDEYASYTSSRVVQTDILQFWQVRRVFQLHSRTNVLVFRPMSELIRQYLRLPWTTFPFKHPPFLVNVSSRLVLRPTQRSAIDWERI